MVLSTGDERMRVATDGILSGRNSVQCRPHAPREEVPYAEREAYTSRVQSNQRYPGEFDLQIDRTENLMYGDSGVG